MAKQRYILIVFALINLIMLATIYNLNQKIVVIRDDIHSIKAQKSHQNKYLILQQLYWLISNAQWQVNKLSDTKSAKQYLLFAEKIADQYHLLNLKTSIVEDLQTIKQLQITSPDKLIALISELKNTLAQMLVIKKTIVQPIRKELGPTKWQTSFAPFIQITKYQQPYIKIHLPKEKNKIINNALSLLEQLQYLGIHKQDHLYHKLMQAELGLCSLISLNTETEHLLAKLANFNFAVNQPINLQSLTVILQLLETQI